MRSGTRPGLRRDSHVRGIPRTIPRRVAGTPSVPMQRYSVLRRIGMRRAPIHRVHQLPGKWSLPRDSIIGILSSREFFLPWKKINSSRRKRVLNFVTLYIDRIVYELAVTLSSGDLFIAHDYPTLKNTTVNIRNIFYVNGPGRVMNEFICHFNK